MPSTTQKKQRSTKLFQCTGYGDCKMVFTRGEHLARHKRKHTGEKPFRCIIPDCNKSFSRFDNMMQHTQTHRKDPQQTEERRNYSQGRPIIVKSLSPQEQSTNKVILHEPSPSTINTNAPYSTFQPQDTVTTTTTTSSNGNLSEHHVGSESPASLASVSVMDCASSSSSSSDDDDDDDDDVDDEEEEVNERYYRHDGHTHWIDHSYRQLSVADMCNPMVARQSLKIEQLTSDEVEVIQAFGKLRQATC